MSDKENLYKLMFTWLAGYKECYVLAENEDDIRKWFNDTYRMTNCEISGIELIDDKLINLMGTKQSKEG